MKILFLSNYFNHHQKPFCDALVQLVGENFTFIETETMEQERINMGWSISCYPSYVVQNHQFLQNEQQYVDEITNSDVVIVGSATKKMLKERIKKNKLIFFYSERPLKNGMIFWKYPIQLVTWRLYYPQKDNVLMLCSSAFTSSDFNKYKMFTNRCLKWGYFPKMIEYADIHSMISNKKTLSILWVARMIEFKHPEMVIELAKKLKENGYTFKIKMIGIGPLLSEIQYFISNNGLEDDVELLGSMTPELVREHMEQSEIFLFTSDKREGWGAVLNEAMNSACAVVASDEIGSVPFLIQHNQNGLIYINQDINDFYEKVKMLLDDSALRQTLGKKAYETIIHHWNAQEAAMRFVQVSEELLECKTATYFEEGPCSKAEILKDSWFR